MNSQTTKKVTLALGVASLASTVGDLAVKAGPALQTLNNLTNTAEFSINNTYGQSFSVDGIITASVTPFAAFTATDSPPVSSFNANTATLTTGFSGSSFGGSLSPVSQVLASAEFILSGGGLVVLNGSATTAGLSSISLAGVTATQTIGASISSTLFGPSTVKATSSFTNQLINDLSAF